MRNTRSFFIGPLPIGGGAPVTVQSMTNTDTRDAAATLSQVRALAQAGCDIVRLSVYDEQCLEALPTIIEGSPVPLVADIHYRADLAVGAMERGIAKVRINPGNIGSVREVRRVADCAKMHHVPIRIGVNSGSVEKEILAQEGGVTARGMLRSALGHARLLEEAGFHDIVLSLKASSVPLTVEAYRLAAKETDYPLHVGVTEAGLPGAGNIKSAIGIGALLLDGIGDTIRVSLTGSPIPEAAAAIDILRAVGLRTGYVNVVSCPTCGRTGIDVAAIARRVESELADIRVPLTVAVMGCVVNGPGEAREADIGLAGGGLSRAGGSAGGEGSSYAVGAIFEKGKAPEKVEGDLAAILIERARRLAQERAALFSHRRQASAMPAPDGIFADVVAHLRHVHGLADEEDLALEAAQLLEELKLVLVFDALGAHMQVQRMRHVQDRHHQAAGLLMSGHERPIGFVQLQAVEVHLAQQIDIGVSRAEIGQPQADATLVVQGVEVGDAPLGQVLRLADLKLHFLRLEAGFFEHGQHIIHKGFAIGIEGQQVHGQRHVGIRLLGQVAGRTHGVFQKPA